MSEFCQQQTGQAKLLGQSLMNLNDDDEDNELNSDELNDKRSENVRNLSFFYMMTKLEKY